MKCINDKYKKWFSGVIYFLLIVTTLSLFLFGCSVSHSNVYKSAKLKENRMMRIAVMPMIILAASKTTVSSTYTSTWISETWTTMALSPAEYLPAEQAFMESLTASFPKIELVSPRIIDEKMRGQKIPNYEQAVVQVAKRFNADAVFTIKIRNLNLRGGNAFEDHTGKGDGHVDLSIHDRNGTILWSVSSDVRYVKGTFLFNIIPDPPPSLSEFIAHVMKEMDVHLMELAKTIATTQKASAKSTDAGEASLTLIGTALLQKGKYDQAISYYNQALEKNPNYANAYLSRGAAYSLKGQNEQAILDFNNIGLTDFGGLHIQR